MFEGKSYPLGRAFTMYINGSIVFGVLHKKSQGKQRAPLPDRKAGDSKSTDRVSNFAKDLP